MISKFINLKGFKNTKISNKTRNNFKMLLKQKSEIIKSLGSNYTNSYNSQKIKKKFEKKKDIRIIGMGGSITGAKAIYDIIKRNGKKNFYFIDNLYPELKIDKKKNYLNLIISKSGNTLETISNFNILLKKKDENIFITENKNNYLKRLALSLKSEIIHHNNFIGGRYSVLSEVGMLPAELMGLNPNKFRQLNNIVKNKRFINALLKNVDAILSLTKKNYFNSIILNYDPNFVNFLEWYKQLVGESLGKKGKGLLPVISNMPKDNHSVMQLFLDGFKKNFYTFFFYKTKKSSKIEKNKIKDQFYYLRNKSIHEIMESQKIATEKVFLSKKIPFREFEILNKNEKTLGELFIFFILETILLGKALNVNPYDQPSVELIKTETKKILIK